MNAKTIFRLVVSLVLAILIIYLVMLIAKPKPIVDMLVKNLNIGPNVPSLVNTEQETFVSPSTKIKGTIYHHNLHYLANHSRILIDIPGGAFLRSSNTMVPYLEMQQLTMPVISISYPVLFDVTSVKLGLDYIMDALRHVIATYTERLVHINPNAVLDVNVLASSAGAYYAVLAINSNEFVAHISKVVIVCGYFGQELTSNQFFKLLHRIYLTPNMFRSSPELKCYPIRPSVATRLITTTDDFLRDSTQNFASMSAIVPFVYAGGHSLFWSPEMAEAQQMYSDITDFLMNDNTDEVSKNLLKFASLCDVHKEKIPTNEVQRQLLLTCAALHKDPSVVPRLAELMRQQAAASSYAAT